MAGLFILKTLYPLTYDESHVGTSIKIVVTTATMTITTMYPQAYTEAYRQSIQNEIFEKLFTEEENSLR